MLTMLAVDSISKQETLVPSPELLKKPDCEPSNRKYMLQSGMRAKWLEGEKEEGIICLGDPYFPVRLTTLNRPFRVRTHGSSSSAGGRYS